MESVFVEEIQDPVFGQQSNSIALRKRSRHFHSVCLEYGLTNSGAGPLGIFVVRFLQPRRVPRVAVLVSSISGGGTEKSVRWLAKGLAKSNFEVDLIVVRRVADIELSVSADVNLISLGKLRTRAGLLGLVSYLRRNRPDVIFSALDAANVLSLIAVKLACVGTKTIISARGDPRIVHEVWSLRGAAVRLLRGFLYRGSDAIHAVSQGVATKLEEEIGLRADQISVIAGPVLPPVESLIKARAGSVPEEVLNGGPFILAAGRLVREKDFETLIFAFSLIASKIPHKLVIVGGGEMQATLERRSGELGLTERILFMGYVDNVYPYMEAAELFVLSSRSEGMPGVLIQALACGANVVSTDCDFGPREILDGGKWGTLVEVGDPDQLARHILDQVSPDRNSQSLLRAREYSFESSISQFRDLILETLG